MRVSGPGLVAIIVAALLPEVSAADRSMLTLPAEFRPVDTSRLMGSPDPLPLVAKPAFPHEFVRPVELTHAGDGSGRFFVVEQRGMIHVFGPKPDQPGKVFLDIRDKVLSKGNEEGLLGLAFHPKYRENGEFYVYYCAHPRLNVLARYKVPDDPNQADAKSEERLFEIKDPYENHNGGSIRFGRDGYLYVGLGDGGSRDDPHHNGQDLSTLLGSILRIDVDGRDKGLNYAIPKDNPFVAREGARGEIWAYGLRNVWRLGVDRKTGDLWAADVGQDRFEEINLIRRGGNYGWNYREASHDFKAGTPAKRAELIDPLVEYFRHDGTSVTGGTVYRGKKLKNFDGAYFFGDYVSGNIWIVRLDDEQQVKEHKQVARTNLGIAAFGEDEAGEMYVCAFDGKIYELTPAPVDEARNGDAFPRQLSETGLFANVKENIPAAGLIPYEVNLPFWSDYAVKDRYLALPKEASVKFDPREKWEFPVGTVFVKTFWMHQNRAELSEPQRIETRLFLRSPRGWEGYTYLYNDDQSDAVLLDGEMTITIPIKTADGETQQRYSIPARNDCFACHTKQEGFVLGLSTRQMNRELEYHGERENQIEMLDRLGAFTEKLTLPKDARDAFPDWGFGNFDRDESTPERNRLKPPAGKPDLLARAWLDVNCAVCHRPQGIAPRERDMRFHTALDKTNMLDAAPKHGQMTAPGGKVIKAGSADESELLRRAAHRGGLGQMPPLTSHTPDERGLAALRQWIDSLKDTDDAPAP